MKTPNNLVLAILFISIFSISCQKEPTGFYSELDREQISKHEPNILFSNYHLLDADKYIELKYSVGNDFKTEFQIVCSFLKGTMLKFNEQEFEINEQFQTILINDFKSLKNETNLIFEINNQLFSFPKTKLMAKGNNDFPNKIRVGSKLNWKAGNCNDKVVMAIRPNQKDCGKINKNGKKYGTRPQLIQDSGEYFFQSNDFGSIGLDYKNEVSVLLKRGAYKMDKLINKNGFQNICISAISHTTFKARIGL